MTDDTLQDSQPALDRELENEKQAQLEEEKNALLRDVIAVNLDTTQKRVAWILNHFPDTRNSDITLQLKYWVELLRFRGRVASTPQPLLPF